MNVIKHYVFLKLLMSRNVYDTKIRNKVKHQLEINKCMYH